ncbi:MAG: DivIVA domain-containing protein [Acidobacteriia bacterium]|nr:DivIVA domain-containing protein [Terriglobia bacterium]
MSSRLTAMDVEKQDFKRSMRGFDRDEVRLFLTAVSEEIERLNLDNAQLREESGTLRGRIDDFRERERMLQETLVTAQKMSEELAAKTHRESELLIKEARIKAERLLEQAQDQLSRIEAEIGRVKLERDAFENRLRSAIEEHLALLDLRKQERAELDNVRFLRRRNTSTEAG